MRKPATEIFYLELKMGSGEKCWDLHDSSNNTQNLSPNRPLERALTDVQIKMDLRIWMHKGRVLPC